MFTGSDYVSFAHITPLDILPCSAPERSWPSSHEKEQFGSLSPSPPSSDVREVSQPLRDVEGRVFVKFIDTLKKNAKAKYFSIQSDATMAYMYKLVNAWLPEVGTIICYTAQTDERGRIFPLVKEVLSPEAEVPAYVFCQSVPQSLDMKVEHYGVVNILVLHPDGDLVSGYVPLIVSWPPTCSIEMLQEQIGKMCCTSPSEVTYMKLQPVVNCSVRSGVVTLTSLFRQCEETDEKLPQVAIIYPALSTGDLVQVDMMDQTGRRLNVQGMIKRTQHKDNVIYYDVEDTSLNYIMEGLTCAQVLPLQDL
ncbi:hypothetical protein ERJ75_001054600 [Trypanosoma vivax]|uniref:Uncharacterized protein n=1 Tax=Trypanosoma vivax (strain Y486) TaxID=1055687 RepID=G0U0E0_TRYVY|nr:hypothetical protein TRVL_05378 [Trypanosoma vivax]KAH8610873.1 hypothetical protein ERJ75_001054600 [Trypanosoma vivax]CCC49538.1 conserved hypothetical protein [Trypanosoma vivax Y486]